MISSREMGRRIAHARKNAGLTQAEVASKLGVSRPTLVKIEKGERQVTEEELLALVDTLGTSVNAILKEHAVTADVAPRFRWPSRPDLPDEQVHEAVNRLRLIGQRYAELEKLLERDRSPSPLELITNYKVPGPGERLEPASAGESAAGMARNILGLGQAPIGDLAAILESGAGLRVFGLNLPGSIAAILLWSDEIGACVAVNSRHPSERQRMSLAHECGHFLRDREAGEVLPAGGRRRMDPGEVFADRFMIELLMPATAISGAYNDVRAQGRFRVGDALRLADRFGVSFEAMMRRLEELRHIPLGSHERVTGAGFAVREAQAEVYESPRNLGVPSLPDRYQALACEAYDQALLSETELSEYLGTDRVTARRIYQRWSEVEAGDATVKLDLTLELMPEAKPGDTV